MRDVFATTASPPRIATKATPSRPTAMRTLDEADAVVAAGPAHRRPRRELHQTEVLWLKMPYMADTMAMATKPTIDAHEDDDGRLEQAVKRLIL